MKKKVYFRTVLFALGVLALSFFSLFVFVAPKLKDVSEGAGLSVDWEEGDGTIYEGLSYGSGSQNLYDLYVPAGEEQKEKHGAILFLVNQSGGEGDRSGMAPYCKRYAKEGYMTLAVEYSAIDSKDSGVTVYSILDEISQCVESLKEKTEELGCPVSQIALSGVSGSGHLALLYSYSRSEESALPVAFTFVEAALTDFHSSTLGIDEAETASLLRQMTGMSMTVAQLKNHEAEDLISSISPLAWVSKEAVPTVLAYGGKDETVLPVNGELLEEALKEQNVPCQYIVFSNSNHGMYEDADCRETYQQAVLEYARTYFGY